jgi:hypothetical protein
MAARCRAGEGQGARVLDGSQCYRLGAGEGSRREGGSKWKQEGKAIG